MNKRFWMALMAVSVLFGAPACSDDDETTEPEPEVDPVLAVYATGADGTQGVYWRNGESVTLKSPISETAKWTRGKSIQVVDGTVYVAGYENKTAILWVNGEPTALTDNSTEVSVNDLAVVGQDVYVVGAHGGAGVYWKNGVKTEVCSFGEVRSIVVDGTDIYMAGNDNGQATFWKNGKAFALCEDKWSASDAYGICVSEFGVIAAGYYDAEAAMWLYDEEGAWETVLTEDWNYAQCRGVVCDAKNEMICSVGNDGYNPVYWEGEQMVKLAECASFGTATDVCYYGGHLYIGGIQDNQAVVWIDGEAQVLADAKTGPSIFGIYVTEEYPVAE